MCQGQAAADLDYGRYTAHPMDPRTPNDDTAHDMAMDAFWVAVEKGDDKCLQLDNRGRTSAAVSQLLIDQKFVDADILFKACHEAVNGRHGMASSLLARYVERAASEYADDNDGAWA